MTGNRKSATNRLFLGYNTLLYFGSRDTYISTNDDTLS